MERILCLDYGKRRTGVAISNPCQTIAFPVKTIPTHDLIPFLAAYIPKEHVKTIVVGWPTRLDGSDSDTTRLVAGFIRFLKNRFPLVSVVPYDERFTSAIAVESLIIAGVKQKKRRQKGRLDTISATLILQSFLASKEYANTPHGGDDFD